MSSTWRNRKYSHPVNGPRVEDRPLSETRPTYVFLIHPGNVPQDIPDSYGELPKDVNLSRAIFQTAENELRRICEDSCPEERFVVHASFMVLVRRDPLVEKESLFPEGFKYSAEEVLELKKPTVDVFVESGHGVQFPDGSWMSDLASNQFHGHMEYGSCCLCPKTGYMFNPDKFWGMSGNHVPNQQHVFGPPEGSTGGNRWSPTEDCNVATRATRRAEYDRIRQVIVQHERERARKAQESLDAFDRDHAQLMEH